MEPSMNENASLRSCLQYEPEILRFGTSGRRGKVVDLTQLEVYINARAELEYLKSLPAEEGGISEGDPFYFAYDLRPSSTRFVAEQKGRGELAQTIERAIRDAGLIPVNLGAIPTPALAYYGFLNGKGSIMVTGSHIPFDRNGYKVNTGCRELLKKDEEPIGRFVDEIRTRLYDEPLSTSLFNEHGMFKSGHSELGPVDERGKSAYIERYLSFFADRDLKGLRVLVYQHSAVGRDILAEVLGSFGAEVICAGRSDTFVPIDTENIDQEILAQVGVLVDEARREYGSIDAVVSTDGDSDRPLVLAPTSGSGGQSVRFFGGDRLGMLVAEFLQVDSVVVPISCNDAVDFGSLRDKVEPKTRIGSPFVIAGIEKARAKGKRRTCGWEANGGFLLGSDIYSGERTLRALPTRDALLPVLCVLFAAKQKGISLVELFESLPARYSKASLLREFPRSRALGMLARLRPTNPEVCETIFEEVPRFLDEEGREVESSRQELESALVIRSILARLFSSSLGFGAIEKINYTDGVRVYFTNRDIAHIRPSGNADELRIYAVADSQERADEIARLGVSEPDGILRRMERELADGC